MTTLNKRYDAQVKALGDGAPGRFEAIVAVFDNVDLSGDRVLPGAFTKSLDRWRSAGDPIPVIWNHDWADPFSHIGEAAPADVIETSKGLHVVGTLDIANNPKAAQVYTLMKQRRVTEFSFSYAVDEEATARDGANNLKAVDLIEFGPTLKGMNPATELIGVKQVEAKGTSLGAFLTAQVESLVNDRTSRADIVMRLASAANISESTVNQILNGDIACPPMDRLRAFARVLPASIDAIVARGNRDGCQYDMAKAEDESLGHVYVDVEPRLTGPLAAFMTGTTTTTLGDVTVTGFDVIGAKSGRVISSKNEQKIRSAVTALGSAAKALEEVLASLGEVTPPDGGASSDQAKAEEPFGAKAEEPDEVAHADPVVAQWAELTKGLG